MLKAGGYGFIERLWDGKDPHIAYTEPTMDKDIWNPEGLEFNTSISTLITWLLSTGQTGTSFHDI